ncbi:MAG: N-acetyltransferase [Brevinematales bacterium]|nr:N-acetyltransferase [Brevinematales bacterium]
MEGVVHDPENKTFFIEADGYRSYMKYRKISDTVLEYYTTYVPEELRSRGLAQQVVKTALDFARENNMKVIPACSFVDKYLQKNKEYQDLRSN